MPNIQKIHIQEVENKTTGALEIRIRYQERGARESELIPSNLLSSGHQSIITMVGDILVRLFKSQPKIQDPKEFIGIVLIDELETHLHPSWQRKFPKLLSDAFPRIQFIASTHTPLSLLGAPENSVFLKVKRTVERGSTIERVGIDVKDLSPNILLTSPLFDLETWQSVQNPDPDEVQTEDTYKEYEKYKKLYQELRDSGGEVPDHYFEDGEEEA